MARGLKFRILKVDGLYYLCSENKGADELRGYHEADLRLCFRICKKPVFSQCGLSVSAADLQCGQPSYGTGQKDSDCGLPSCEGRPAGEMSGEYTSVVFVN